MDQSKIEALRRLEGRERIEPSSYQSLFEMKYPELYRSFKIIQAEQLELFCKKCLDYGTENIAAGTQLQDSESIKFSLQGIWFRISDKINRWKNLMFGSKELQPANESISDTFQDIANYAMIAQLVYRGKWYEEGSKQS